MIDLKKLALTIGIGVVFAFFVYFAIEAIKPAPTYDTYCTVYDYPRPVKLAPDSKECAAFREDQTYNEQCYREKGMIRYDYDSKGCPTKATCDYCNRDYQKTLEHYNLRIFWVSAAIGIIALVAGMYLPLTVEAIASGFMFGGILTLIQSTVRVFGSLGRYSRVLILGVELIILIWIGVKKVSNLGKRKKEEKHARTQKRLLS